MQRPWIVLSHALRLFGISTKRTLGILLSHIYLVLRKTVKYIGRLSKLPIFWGAIYFLMIPIFAALFWVNSGSFKFAYSKDEAAYNEEFDKLINFFRGDMTLYFDVFCRINQCDSHLVIERVKSIENEEIVLDLVIAGNEFDEKKRSNKIIGSVEYSLFQNKYIIDPSDIPVLNLVRKNNSATPQIHPDLDIVTIPVNREVFTAFLIVTDGSDGIYSDLKKNYSDIFGESGYSIFGPPWPADYSRYLYFSAVTISTLGYGDIVPIDDRGRMLVALEAICGLLIMGLFLNSVARRP